MGGPTFNIYNGCCDSACSCSGSNDTASSISGQVFPIRAAMDNMLSNWTTGDLGWVTYTYAVNPGLGKTVIYNPMQYMHFPYRLRDAAFVKFNPTGTTTKGMIVEVIVMDTNGTVKRVLSTSSVDVIGGASEAWLPFALTSDPTQRIIALGEVAVARFTISGANTDSWQCYGLYSGLGEYI